MSSATIRDYLVESVASSSSPLRATVKVIDKTKSSYAALPTLREINTALDLSTIQAAFLDACFKDCTNLVSAPSGFTAGYWTMNSCFEGCTSLTSPPVINSSVYEMYKCFKGCVSLVNPPTINSTVLYNMRYCFEGCTSLSSGPTIPSSVQYIDGCFKYCSSLRGSITINANPTGYYSDCFLGTVRDIYLFGSSTLLSELAATSPNGNVHVGYPTYSITYLDKGGSAFSGVHAAGYPTTHTYGYTTFLDSPTKAGFTFGGYFTNSSCSGNPITYIYSTVSSNTTLYALWIENDPKLSINVNGSWKNAESRINVNGVWKEVDNILLNVNGSWKEVPR